MVVGRTGRGPRRAPRSRPSPPTSPQATRTIDPAGASRSGVDQQVGRSPCGRRSDRPDTTTRSGASTSMCEPRARAPCRRARPPAPVTSAARSTVPSSATASSRPWAPRSSTVRANRSTPRRAAARCSAQVFVETGVVVARSRLVAATASGVRSSWTMSCRWRRSLSRWSLRTVASSSRSEPSIVRGSVVSRPATSQASPARGNRDARRRARRASIARWSYEPSRAAAAAPAPSTRIDRDPVSELVHLGEDRRRHGHRLARPATSQPTPRPRPGVSPANARSTARRRTPTGHDPSTSR